MNVIPDKCLFHFLALAPEAAETNEFFGALLERRPGVRVEGEGWQLAAGKRRFAFGTISDGAWSWRVVIELAPIPEAAWRPGFADTKPPAHKAHSLVFLLAAPEGASGLDRVRASLDLALAWIDAGASTIAFPSAGTVNDAKTMSAVEPERLDADHASALMVSMAMMGSGEDGRTWLRTRGLSQFGLPDLCTTLPAMPQPPAESIQRAQVLFSSVAPYMIARDRPVQPGEIIKMAGQTWKVGSEQELKSAPPSYGVLRLLEPSGH
jgi:hypothetical protein